jgi:hypothetical protein
MNKNFDPTREFNIIIEGSMKRIEILNKLLSDIEKFIVMSIAKVREKIRPQVSDIIDLLKKI